MKFTIYAVLVLAVFGISIPSLAKPARSNFIEVRFKYGGLLRSCLKQEAYLWWHGHRINAANTTDGFFIPAEFDPSSIKASSIKPEDKYLEAVLTCDNEAVYFGDLSASVLTTTRWDVLIDYPTWSEAFPIPRAGAWSTYLTLYRPCEVPSANPCDEVAARVDFQGPRPDVIRPLVNNRNLPPASGRATSPMRWRSTGRATRATAMP